MKKPKTRQEPFSPALSALLQVLHNEYVTNVRAVVAREAQSLKLPEGWAADIEKRTWTISTG